MEDRVEYIYRTIARIHVHSLEERQTAGRGLDTLLQLNCTVATGKRQSVQYSRWSGVFTVCREQSPYQKRISSAPMMTVWSEQDIGRRHVSLASKSYLLQLFRNWCAINWFAGTEYGPLCSMCWAGFVCPITTVLVAPWDFCCRTVDAIPGRCMKDMRQTRMLEVCVVKGSESTTGERSTELQEHVSLAKALKL